MVGIPWFKVDDGLPTSRKLLSIPRRMRLPALGLWTLAGAWSARELTDGHVPAYMLEEWGATDAQATCLVNAGLWYAERNGYVFHDWHDYQPERVKVLEDRENAKIRMKRVREARRSGEQGANVHANDSRTSAEVRLTPTRPDPTRPKNEDPVQPKAERKSDYPIEFETWWGLYPRKESKGAALKAWQKARKLVDAETLANATQAYTLMCLGKEKQFVKLPAGWLNDRKWEDDYGPARGRPQAPTLGAEGALCGVHPGYPLPCLRCDETGVPF